MINFWFIINIIYKSVSYHQYFSLNQVIINLPINLSGSNEFHKIAKWKWQTCYRKLETLSHITCRVEWIKVTPVLWFVTHSKFDLFCAWKVLLKKDLEDENRSLRKTSAFQVFGFHWKVGFSQQRKITCLNKPIWFCID
jgi:hypothetical protein